MMDWYEYEISIITYFLSFVHILFHSSVKSLDCQHLRNPIEKRLVIKEIGPEFFFYLKFIYSETKVKLPE